jgi:hypothetical protein
MPAVTPWVGIAALAVALPVVGTSPALGQGLPPVQREFSNGSVLRFYGQINKGILGYDDGVDTETYYIIDNDNSNTRFGLRYTQEFTDWSFENVNEFQYAPYSTTNVNIIDQSPSRSAYDWSNSNIRKIDFTLDNDRYGKFWLGQGSMATDGIAEIDLSGTSVIAYSSVADSAGGQIIRYADPNLSFDDNPRNKDVFDNFDGGRLVRLRYDTPSFAGFSVAAAFGQNLLSDDQDERTKNRYERQLLDFQLQRLKVRPERGGTKYLKIHDNDDAASVRKQISSFDGIPLTSLVFNFLDILAHGRSESEILQELAPDEAAFRAVMKAWFLHSPLYDIFRALSRQDCKVVVTTDHGAVLGRRAALVHGNRDTSTNLRYKFGLNLKVDPKQAIVVKNPIDFMLPDTGVNKNYILAREDFYFVYPTRFHEFERQFRGSFQHGGVSVEEMILPLVTLTPRRS